MSRRQRSAPAVKVSPSVRLGLESMVDGNEEAIRAMLSADRGADLVQKLIDCMGVNGLSAEMLLANYFNVKLLGKYALRIGKSDKGSSATLAERIAREWAKPAFSCPGRKRQRTEGESIDANEVAKPGTINKVEVEPSGSEGGAEQRGDSALKDARRSTQQTSQEQPNGNAACPTPVTVKQ